MEPNRPAADRISSDRVAWPILSSRAARIAIPALLLLSVAGAAATLTLQQPYAPMADAPATTPSAAPATMPTDPLWTTIDQWNRLRQSDRLPFASYASFLMAHRGWPGEMATRRAAERAIDPASASPSTVVGFLTAFPPLTQSGRVRLAEALAALNQPQAARDAAAAAWAGGALSPDDEARLSARFAGQFTPDEQDRRMDQLLWDGATSSASRHLAYVTPGRRPIYAARLAFQTKATDAAIQATEAGPEADRDAGFVADRARWLRDINQGVAARAFLAQPRTLVAAPIAAKPYLETLLTAAKGAATDNQPSIAYGIVQQAAGAFPPGTVLRDRPLSERDPFTSLLWLGGQTALTKLARPRDAEAMFMRYGQASQSPGGQAKGEYWAGRAAEQAGDQAGAAAHYANAARQIDQYYGQLATERLGRPIAIPPDPPRLEVSTAERAAFRNREVVRAAVLLGGQRRWIDQTPFVRQIAQDAKTDADHVLVSELSRDLGRPDLAVITSRQARQSGARDPIRMGFPRIPVPPAMESHWTIIHALTRQESQFDQAALSGAGAQGLMQLMNPTAREQAGKLGLPWDQSRLTSDPGYNVMLGSSFFDRMLTYYNGSYVLAVASYNAGPGNVNKFIRANGDPRMPGVDVVDWIEAIPLTETRGYVQKVLENAVIYDLFNPERARTPEKDRLSWYLGKKSAG